MKKEIIHIYPGHDDYSLCGWASDEFDEFGVANAITAEETYEDTVALRRKYNTNCERCQKCVVSILAQIKRK